MKTVWRRLQAGLAAILAIGAVCCAEETADEAGPRIAVVSDDAVTLGETFYFGGHGLKTDAAEGKTRLTFIGEYRDDDGATWDVDFTFTPLFDGTAELDGETYQVMRWSRFGPFSLPFGRSKAAGLFTGHVLATNVLPDGTEIAGAASPDIELAIEPSVAIEALRPYFSECSAPAIRGLGGLPYYMKVRAIGIAPEVFRYTLTNVNGSEAPVIYEKPADEDGTGVLGETEAFVLNDVPEEYKNAVSTITIQAEDADGQIVETVLPLSVHRPMEVIYNGELDVAEYYPPVPVTGCIPGAPENVVLYSESEQETKQQSVSVTISKQWTEAHGVTDTSNWMEGYTEGVVTTHSETNDIRLTEAESVGETYGITYAHTDGTNQSFTTSDGESWQYDNASSTTESEWTEHADSSHWDVNGSVTAGAKGGAKVPLVAEGEVYAEATVGGEYGQGDSDSLGKRTDVQTNVGYSVGGTHNSANTYGSVTTDTRSETFQGDYRLTRTSSTGHAITDTEARSESRTYSLGGSEASSETVSEGMSEAEARTWTESSSHTTLTSYSGVIPEGAYGVFYRQTMRLVRKAYVVSYDLCGVAHVQGEMVFNEWSWAPELAVGPSCLPESSFPPAACLIEPCGY